MPEGDLGAEFEKIAHTIKASNFHNPATNLVFVTALLGQSIVKLDKSSTRLARINIGLAVVVIVIGGLQVYLMLKGH